MKILCVCSRGNVRSVNLAYLLRDAYGVESLAMGWNSSSNPTRHSLFGWADIIVVLDEGVSKLIPENVTGKVHEKKIRHCFIDLDKSGIDYAFDSKVLEDLKQFIAEKLPEIPKCQKPIAFWG